MKKGFLRPAALINALFAFSILITAMGTGFAVYSTVKNVSLNVLTSQVPGAVFGAIIAFLGVRYLLAVRKLKAEVFKTKAEFSRDNLGRTHPQSVIKKQVD